MPSTYLEWKKTRPVKAGLTVEPTLGGIGSLCDVRKGSFPQFV